MTLIISAFFAGILTFLSPCILPLLPGYLSFMTGISLGNLKSNRSKVLLNSLFFTAGFSIIFILLGASATFIGKVLLNNLNLFNKIGGVLIIIFGLQVSGILNIKFLNMEKRIHLQNSWSGLWGSFLLGIFFGFGWSPCIGPILGAILILASEQSTVSRGMVLLTVYSLGISIPFILSALALESFLKIFQNLKKYFRSIEFLAGGLLIIMGALMFFGQLGKLNIFLLK